MTKKKHDPATMDGRELQAALDRLGISQRGFSRLVRRGERTVRSWIADEYPTPAAEALLLHLMISTNTRPEDLGYK